MVFYRKIIKQGDSKGIILPRDLVRELEWNENTEIKLLVTDASKIVELYNNGEINKEKFLVVFKIERKDEVIIDKT